MKQPLATFAAVAAVVFLLPAAGMSQTCRLQTITGSSATSNVVTGYEKTPTNVANAAAVDSTYYELTNALGLGPSVTIRGMYSDWIETNASKTNTDPTKDHSAYYGATFVNPTNSAITITRVDFTTDVDNFTASTIRAFAPTTGWQPVSSTNASLVQWIGSIVVPSRGTQDFIFGDSPQNNAKANTTRSVTISPTFTTSAGTFSGTPFTFTALTSTKNNASNAVVSFDKTGGAIPVPVLVVPGKSSSAPIDLPIRVGESGNNGTSSAIASGLQLTVTIPKRWSSVSVPTIGAPWSAATLTITQPTATTDGQVTIQTNASIASGSATAPNTLVIRATAPASSVTNLFPFGLAISGTSAGGRSIASFNDSVVQVLGSGTEAINAELLSAAISNPVRQIVFTATMNITDGPGGESVIMQALNTSTSSWDTLATVTPGTTNTTTPFTFTADYATHVDGSRRMKVRFLSNGTTVRTLRIDQISWSVTLGYTVNNATGVDTSNSVGDIAQPFASVQRAATFLGASGAVYVEVGSGAAYAPDIAISGAVQAGTATCSTLIQGVASGGVLPLLRGTSTNDFGFDIASDYVTVDGFRIENTGAAFVVEPGVTGTVMSSCSVQQMTNGYGVILNDGSPSTVLNNTIDAAGSSPLIAVYDGSSQSLIDGNKIVGASSEYGIYAAGNAPTIQRNIVTGAYFGIYLGGTTGTATLYNNTVDSSVAAGIFADGAASVVSRNNISTRSTAGWRANGTGSVDSDYDDVYGNYYMLMPGGTQVTNNYVGVTAGPHSISADPLFADTTTPSSTNYYRLSAGSPCVDAGINVALPFLGTKPDIGATETQ